MAYFGQYRQFDGTFTQFASAFLLGENMHAWVLLIWVFANESVRAERVGGYTSESACRAVASDLETRRTDLTIVCLPRDHVVFKLPDDYDQP